MPDPWQLWQRFQQELKDGEALSRVERVEDLEAFRHALCEVCGEDPTIFTSLWQLVQSADDLVELSLSDYFGWHLKARHGAIYQARPDGMFHCLAAFGRQTGRLRTDGVLLPWLLKHGPLIRSRLTLTGLSVGEAETLLQELDALDAALVIPLAINEALWGVIVIGPPIVGCYDDTEPLHLTLYSLAILRCLARRQQGLPTKSKRQAQEETASLQAVVQFWEVVRPAQPLKLLILDEEPKTVEPLCRFFDTRGFSVYGVTTEADALVVVAQQRPHLLLVDLSLHRRLPVSLLNAVRLHVPNAVLIGTTTERDEAMDRLARSFGVQPIVRKPCRFARLAHVVFEAALHFSMQPASPEAPQEETAR